MGIHDHPTFKLGKQDHKHDDRTLMMANFIEVPVLPASFDFDRHRAKFPVEMWGNDEFGDCVIAAESNALLRMERVEQRRTVKLSDADAITRYKGLTGCQSPGDENDTGLVMLDTMSDWHHNGYDRTAEKPEHSFTIAAYGELDPADDHQLRGAIYLLGGIHFGFALPISAQAQTDKGYWDVVSGPESQAGSWGGHCVYAKRYDADNIYVLTWGMEIRVTNAFIKKYCDEVWVVVDDLDRWRATDHLDVQALIAKLHDIGARNID
jgi:hypothetical protein